MAKAVLGVVSLLACTAGVEPYAEGFIPYHAGYMRRTYTRKASRCRRRTYQLYLSRLNSCVFKLPYVLFNEVQISKCVYLQTEICFSNE